MMSSLIREFVVSCILIYIFSQLAKCFFYKYKIQRNGCVPPPRYPHKDPFLGMDLFLQYMTSFKNGSFLSFNKCMFDRFGKTFQANALGTRTFRTISPDVSKAVHSTYASKFGLRPLRYDVAKHLWGNGIIVVDGQHWKHGRALMRPSFDVVHLANFDRLRKHTELFMTLIPKDGSTVDLMPLFMRLILDTSSDFIFGEAMGALSDPGPCEEFSEAFAYAQKGTGIRAMLRRFKFLHWDKKWWKACQKITDYADKHVDLALRRLEERPNTKESAVGTRVRKEHLKLVDEMAKDTQDRLTLRSHIISVFSPAHDGAAIALTNALFHLARHPAVWSRLQEEIQASRHDELTYDLLNSFQYLNWVIRETHRLTPIATMNARQCLESTVLPVGGGSDGRMPLYVQKGDNIEINYRAMFRDESFWGVDADKFVPERWEHIRPGWEYTPFGGGPRSCPGMRLVFTETAYVIVCLLRQFTKIENRDPEIEWKEEMRMTFQSKNGCLVGLLKS